MKPAQRFELTILYAFVAWLFYDATPRMGPGLLRAVSVMLFIGASFAYVLLMIAGIDDDPRDGGTGV